MDVKGFLKRAFVPIKHNPGGIQTSAVITLIGAVVWATCVIGTAFGYAVIPDGVDNIGSLIFGIGMGKATNPQPEVDEPQ